MFRIDTVVLIIFISFFHRSENLNLVYVFLINARFCEQLKKKEIWKPKKCGRYLFNFNVNLSEIWWRYDEQSNVYSSGHEHPMTNVSSQEIPMIYHEFVMLCPLFIPCLFPFISWRENLERKLVWNADAKWLVWVAAANYWNKISYKSIFAFQIISLSLFQRHKSHSWNWNIQSGE